MLFELLAIIGSAFVVGLTGALAPGPLLALDIRESMRIGVRAGVLVSTGHAFADLAMLLLLASGIRLLVDERWALAVVGVVGGLFLVWMGWTMARTIPATAPWKAVPSIGEEAVAPAGESRVHGAWNRRDILAPLVGGALVSVANPYWSIWWITVGGAFLANVVGRGSEQTYAFYLGHILADYVWYVAVAFALGSGRRLMSDGAFRLTMLGSAVLLAVAGVVFVARGGAQSARLIL